MATQPGTPIIADPANERPQRRTPTNPSPRQPHKDTKFNRADITERLMREDNHRSWGYIIYRTTYASNDDWNEFLRRLQIGLEHTFDRCNGRDVLQAFNLTIFDDKSLFDQADTAAVRAHFKRWAEQAWRTEQQPQAEAAGEDTLQVTMGRNPRYQFCVQVDEPSLRSVVYDAPSPPRGAGSGKGWVKLISKNYVPIDEDPLARPGRPIFDAVDGITEHDVGWMKVPYQRVMTDFYSGAVGLNGWRMEYCRPPEVSGAPFSD